MRRSRKEAKFTLFAFQDIITGLCGVLTLFVLVMLVDFATRKGEKGRDGAPASAVVAEADREKLKKEIETLKEELDKIRKVARLAVVAGVDAAAPEEEERIKKEISEKELELAALATQLESLKTKVEAAKKADAANRKAVLEMEQTRRLLEARLAELKGRKGVTLIPERGETKIPVYLICGRGGVEMLKPGKGGEAARKRFSGGNLMRELESELLKFDHTTHTVIALVRPSGTKWMDAVTEKAKGLGFSCGRDPLEEDAEVNAAYGGGGK